MATPTRIIEEFKISPAFNRLISRFQDDYFTSFPSYPCGYCGTLSTRRTTHWVELDQHKLHRGEYGLVTRLECDFSRDILGRIAICSICKKHPREAPDAGPWPAVLLCIPQRSKMFLSFIKLNCNLGRTQSHGESDWHNPYSTYRTLSGTYLYKVT